MFSLFKKRDFSDYIGDTFQFFRETGKHYLTNYFTICGIFLMVLVVLSYFLFQVYFDFFLNIGRLGNNFQFIQNYMENKATAIIIGALLLFLFIVFLSMLTHSIPVIYMDLYVKNNGDNFGPKEILARFKAEFGRILLFFLGMIFIITPLLIVVFVLLGLLCLILIGFPLILFAIPTALSWVTLSYYEYINEGKTFFQALGSGFKHLKNQFFPNVGSLMILYIIVQVALTIFIMVPYAIGIVSVMTSVDSNPSSDRLSGMKILLTIIMVVSMLMSYILNNLLFINQGLVYYSRKENDENISSHGSIDLIGSE